MCVFTQTQRASIPSSLLSVIEKESESSGSGGVKTGKKTKGDKSKKDPSQRKRRQSSKSDRESSENQDVANSN